MENKKRKILTKTIFICAIVLVSVLAISLIYIFSINAYVVGSTKGKVLSVNEAAEISDVDCILILGCKVQNDGELSYMLNDRMEVGISVYFAMSERKNHTKILVSGDHGTLEYDEVNAMKEFAIDHGIESKEIFMDHAGFSTYESIYRAKEIFGADKIIVVTQEYHLYRALYIAESLGVEAYGVAADLRSYAGQLKYDLREILARNKDFVTLIFKPEPTYLGDRISLDGNGDVTND